MSEVFLFVLVLKVCQPRYCHDPFAVSVAFVRIPTLARQGTGEQIRVLFITYNILFFLPQNSTFSKSELQMEQDLRLQISENMIYTFSTSFFGLPTKI
jgi:hypothetical protein